MLADFDTPQRSLFLKFVWGRARLAVTEDAFATPMKIQRLAKPDPDKFLPPRPGQPGGQRFSFSPKSVFHSAGITIL